MISIKNRAVLIENGKSEPIRRARQLALDSLQAAVNAADPKASVTSKLTLQGNTLQVGTQTFDLSEFRHIYVLGGGKAAGPMAEATEVILGKHITEGAINVPYGAKAETQTIKITQARHPVPDEAGVGGTQKMLAIAEKAGKEDLVICLISGGGSSLMVAPKEGISIGDKQQLTNALLRSGATINEVNSVRKHLSAFKGGWLAKTAYPATVLNLILSDVVGDPLDVIASGPTVADSSTFADACAVLEKYSLWADAPASVRKVLDEGRHGLLDETPKAGDAAFERVFNVVVGNVRAASLAACSHLREAGLNTVLLTCALEGEAKCVGGLLASVGREILLSANPAAKPAAVVAGGETTVKVTGKGLGGRNQELALSAALKLKGASGCVVVASLGTDGVDGPTDAAGAIVDIDTCKRAAQKGLLAEAFLAENDSYHLFSELGDLIFTGQTGTNVNDIVVVVVL
jgi:hydroxypyruvate reductase